MTALLMSAACAILTWLGYRAGLRREARCHDMIQGTSERQGQTEILIYEQAKCRGPH